MAMSNPVADGGEDIKTVLKRLNTGERLKVLVDEPGDGDARAITGRVNDVRTLPDGTNSSVELYAQGTAVVLSVADTPGVSTRSGRIPMGRCIRVESLPTGGSDAVTPGGGAR